MIDGFINIYKEQGFTSFDVVAKLRGILKQKKIGHTGTLDPMAEGVLLVCLGSATKMCDLLTEKNKTYTCSMLLGKTSDTEDVTGVMTDVTDVYPDEKTVRAAVMSFIGDYMQIPPMYSAIKVNGKKLYELARAGQVIEREPRLVTIHGITIQSEGDIRCELFQGNIYQKPMQGYRREAWLRCGDGEACQNRGEGLYYRRKSDA